MILILSILLICVSLVNIWTWRRNRARLQVFYNVEIKNASLSSLVESQLSQKKQSFWERVSFDFNVMMKSYYNLLIMGQSKTRLLIYIFVGTVVGFILNGMYIHFNNFTAILVSAVGTLVVTVYIKKSKLKKEFYNQFPEALNTITGVVSSGSAITTSFKVCGNSINGIVGKTLREVDNRIEIGENIEGVLMNSYQKLPFPEYYFFILTVMVNLDSGGELKEVLNRLTKMLTNNQILGKIRDGKTAELRMTMRVLGCMPFGFIYILKVISGKHYDYLMDSAVGHGILYYVIGSVVIGVIIIKGMINKII